MIIICIFSSLALVVDRNLMGVYDNLQNVNQVSSFYEEMETIFEPSSNADVTQNIFIRPFKSLKWVSIAGI